MGVNVRMGTMRRHLKRKHSEILDSQLQQEFITVGEESDNYESMERPSAWSNPTGTEIIHDTHQRALFILKSREVHKISQDSLSDIITTEAESDMHFLVHIHAHFISHSHSRSLYFHG